MVIRSAAFVNKLKTARRAIGVMGWPWAGFRVRYALKLRTGYFERNLPIRSWQELPIEEELVDRDLARPSSYLQYRKTGAPAFFFRETDRPQYGDFLGKWDGAEFGNCIELADRICKGSLLYFDHHLIDTGLRPDWHKNYFTGERMDPRKHWSRIGDFEQGDIKIIWEPSRFAFSYVLVRAYWRTGSEKYAEAFWKLVEDWREKNPPQAGPNWKCGQEIAIRIMAWCFGLYGFLGSSASTPQRVLDLAQMIAVSARRIQANIDYALSQRNNHGLSEAVSLWTAGVLFPEFRKALTWRRLGKKLIEELARELIYDDGSFVQHSMNYHRLMLHHMIWAVRIGQLNGRTFSEETLRRIEKAGLFLWQVQDPETGQVPCYGQNDGALILPLTNCDHRDYRPVVQSTLLLVRRIRIYGQGPWDEESFWLLGPAQLKAPKAPGKQKELNAPIGGYFTLRNENSYAFLRCGSFRDRPGQADMLHFDLWWRGLNIAIDPGTFSYNGPPPWNNPLAHTLFHNTITVDTRDQMDRASHFLWFPWIKSKVLATERSPKGRLGYWEGTHNGYNRLSDPVAYRRGVLRLPHDSWLVIDGLEAAEGHEYRLHWLFSDWPYRWNRDERAFRLATSAGDFFCHFLASPQPDTVTIVRAEEKGPRGWCAPYYYSKEPAISVELTLRSASAWFMTILTPREISWREVITGLVIRLGNEVIRISLNPYRSGLLLNTVRILDSNEKIVLDKACTSC